MATLEQPPKFDPEIVQALAYCRLGLARPERPSAFREAKALGLLAQDDIWRTTEQGDGVLVALGLLEGKPTPKRVLVTVLWAHDENTGRPAQFVAAWSESPDDCFPETAMLRRAREECDWRDFFDGEHSWSFWTTTEWIDRVEVPSWLTGYCAVCRQHQSKHVDRKCPGADHEYPLAEGHDYEMPESVIAHADPDDLIRWAETYGHPEEWAKRAQGAHARAEKAERDRNGWRHEARTANAALAAMRERAEGAERERDDAVEGVEALEDLVRCVEQVSYEGIAGEVEELDEARRVAGDVLARLRSNEKGAA